MFQEYFIQDQLFDLIFKLLGTNSKFRLGRFIGSPLTDLGKVRKINSMAAK